MTVYTEDEGACSCKCGTKVHQLCNGRVFAVVLSTADVRLYKPCWTCVMCRRLLVSGKSGYLYWLLYIDDHTDKICGSQSPLHIPCAHKSLDPRNSR